MRPLTLLAAVVLAISLGACARPRVPADPGWRDRVLEAISDSPDVVGHTVTVRDLDDGLARYPHVMGRIDFRQAPTPAGVDAVMRRISDVLGPRPGSVVVKLTFAGGGQESQRPTAFGWPDMINGVDLWARTH